MLSVIEVLGMLLAILGLSAIAYFLLDWLLKGKW